MATAKKKTTTAVATKPAGGGELVPFDYGDDAGVGMDITMDDLKIPFIALAQSDSKILDEDEATYAPGGAAGMLFNGATLEYSEDLILCLSVRRTTYVEWAPDRGGFVDEHAALSPVVAEAKRNAAKKYELKTAEGNDLQETRSIFAIVLDGELNPVGYCVVPFTSSKMAPWRDYWTKIDTARVSKSAPLFAHVVRLSSFKDKNRAGDKFSNFVMAPARDAEGALTQDVLASSVSGSMLSPDHPAYLAARELRDAVESGRATADKSTATEGGTGEKSDEVF
jgi:hypothetical protein